MKFKAIVLSLIMTILLLPGIGKAQWPQPKSAKYINFPVIQMDAAGDVLGVKLVPIKWAATSSYIGFVDSADCQTLTLSGWAADRNQPNVPIKVSVTVGGDFLGTFTANQSRPDVATYLGDNGLHGFTVNIPPSAFGLSGNSVLVQFPNKTFLDYNGQALPFSMPCHAPSPMQGPSQSGSLIANGVPLSFYFAYTPGNLHQGDQGSVVVTVQQNDPRAVHTIGFAVSVMDSNGAVVKTESRSIWIDPLQHATSAIEFDLPCNAALGSYKAVLTITTVDGNPVHVTTSSVPLATDTYFVNFTVDGSGILCQ